MLRYCFSSSVKLFLYSTWKNHDNRHITRMLRVLTLDMKANKIGHLFSLRSFLGAKGQRKFHTPSFLQSSILISICWETAFQFGPTCFTTHTGEVMKSSSLETLDRDLRNLFKPSFALSKGWTRWLLEVCHNLNYSVAVEEMKKLFWFLWR